VAILSRIAESPHAKSLAHKLHAVLNDRNAAYSEELASTLKVPHFTNILIGEASVTTEQVSLSLAQEALGQTNGPALWFVDPWGYEGVSRDLIRQCTDGWGSDAILLLNVNAITRSVRNAQEHENLSRFFGPQFFEGLLSELNRDRTRRIEPEVMRTVLNAYRGLGGGRLVSRVGFQFEDRDRSSHFLLLITKHQRGVRTFNDIVERELRESPPDVNGVYVFNSARLGQSSIELITRHSFYDAAAREILGAFGGRRLTFGQLLKESLDTDLQFSDATMRRVILRMEQEGRVEVSVDGVRKVIKDQLTLPPRSVLKFP
jgi:three-Cys-motif partner protein